MSDAERVASTIARELQVLGVREGGDLLVHSSFKSLGTVDGGIETLIQGLLQAVGADGTLLMPALSYKSVDWERPLFNQSESPSCVGAVTEVFRIREGTLRSVQLSHSVCALGKLALWYTAGQENDSSPCGANSAFRRLRDKGGQILMLGCGLASNTSMHAVEELVEPPYLFDGPVFPYQAVLSNGEEITASSRKHHFTGYRQRYDRLEDVLAEGTGLRRGNILDAESHLIEAAPMWEQAEKKLRHDEFYFVERDNE